MGFQPDPVTNTIRDKACWDACCQFLGMSDGFHGLLTCFLDMLESVSY